MLGGEGALLAPIRIVLALVATLMAFCFFSAQAQAAPGAYRVLLAEVQGEGAKRLQAQVAAFPDVAVVDLVDTSDGTPSAAELRAYDVVMSSGDSSYADAEAWGNSLADYVDAGGIVVQSAYDTWNGGGAPTGRWEVAATRPSFSAKTSTKPPPLAPSTPAAP